MFDATCGYESRVVKALSEAGLAAAVVNQTRVRQFAEGVGMLVMTDKINASLTFVTVVIIHKRQ